MRNDVVVEKRDARAASVRHHLSLNDPKTEKLAKSHDADVVAGRRGEAHGLHVVFVRFDSSVLCKREVLRENSSFSIHEVDLNVFPWRERLELEIGALGQRGVFELIADECTEGDRVGHGVEGGRGSWNTFAVESVTVTPENVPERVGENREKAAFASLFGVSAGADGDELGRENT
jgi:hypothetical protein